MVVRKAVILGKFSLCLRYDSEFWEVLGEFGKLLGMFGGKIVGIY